MSDIESIDDLFARFSITSIRSRPHAPGKWVKGEIGDYRYEALVFDDHARVPSYELDESRISKLTLYRLYEKVEVACFDRGWVKRPTEDLAQAAIDILADGLATAVYD